MKSPTHSHSRKISLNITFFGAQPKNNNFFTPNIQRQQTEEEEEAVQTMPLMRKSENRVYKASPKLTSQLNQSKGSGSSLPKSTLSYMNQAFGMDFSQVRVYAGGQAQDINQDIQAKAFTHGSDIYFNQGQYSPESSEGKKLLAHELTHVVQQGGTQNNHTPKLIQRAGLCIELPPRIPHHLLMRNSIHPDVREVQRKLVVFSNNEVTAGRPQLPHMPLVDDCILGPKTSDAVFEFQKRVFPGKPAEWDRKVGDKTWLEIDKVAPTPTPPVVPPSPPVPVSPGCTSASNPDQHGRGFNPTTDSENTVIAKNPFDAFSVNTARDRANAAAARSGLAGPHLGPQDAFRHCIWNCFMTQSIGRSEAEKFATGHENSAPSSIPFDNQMDLHNNSIGRGIGTTSTDCEADCLTEVTSGRLRTIRGPHTRLPSSVTTDCFGASDQPWP